MPILSRLKSAWNVFRNQQEDSIMGVWDKGPNYYYNPSRTKMMIPNERSIISSIYTRISIDVSDNEIRHVVLDEQDRFSANVDSKLNRCLLVQPNLDQGPRAFRQDIAMSTMDKGVCVVVPVDTTNPPEEEEFDIESMRVGEVVAWYPKHVRINLYNEQTALRQEVLLEKQFVAIVENPLYSVMNEPNSTLQRLILKLNYLDAIDAQSSSGKLDLIIQLPYVIKSEARRSQADQRRKDIESQLKGSQYGIAYTESTEKITQLNRPAENNLLTQVEFLKDMLYAQLGLTEDVMNGTADEKAMNNYYIRTVKPFMDAITEAMNRSFLAYRVNSAERIQYFPDPWKFVTVTQIAEAADKFARNEILTSNEIRGLIGFAPSTEEKADKLLNSNMPQQPAAQPAQPQDQEAKAS